MVLNNMQCQLSMAAIGGSESGENVRPSLRRNGENPNALGEITISAAQEFGPLRHVLIEQLLRRLQRARINQMPATKSVYLLYSVISCVYII